MAEKKALFKSLKNLCSLLEKEKIEYMLIGGIAVSILAEPRATVDIDLLVLVEEKNVPFLFSKLEASKIFFYINKDIIIFKKVSFVRTILKGTSEIMVDFLLADDAFKREAISRKQSIKFEEEKIYISTPEDLIILKLLGAREHDILDIEKILQFQEKLDFGYIKKWVKKLNIKISLKLKNKLWGHRLHRSL